MADFRKLLLVLAVLAIVAVPVSAQPFSCTGQPAQPVLIRDGGLTEMVGDVLLLCSGTAATPTVTANIQIFMSPTQVTNRVTSGAGCLAALPNCVTDSALVITDIGGGTVGSAIPGLLQPGTIQNSLLFPGVTVPTGTTTFVRITNVRVKAPPASGAPIPTQVLEFVSTNPVGVFPIANSFQTVAFVQPGLTFTTTDCAGKGTGTTSFTQCNAHNASVTPSVTADFNAQFIEGFPGSFKTQAQESGAFSVADTGTELMLNFTNIPPGVNIFVTTSPVAVTPAASLDASLIDVSGTGTFTPTATTLTCGTTSTSANVVQVPITGGAGSATWEVTAATVGTTQKAVSFGVIVSFTPNTTAGLPGLTGTTGGGVTGQLAPVSTVDVASKTAPIPRFLANPQAGPASFTIVPCVTNLLFPFITNAGGFDTGIALVNTSLDNAGNKQPFNTGTQHGTCTVFYFNGTTTAPAPQTTTDIVAGGLVAFTLQSGGVAGSTSSATGFQGYAIARCNFQFAHGFAFISDRNTPSIGSMGYLALVIPDRGTTTRQPAPFSDTSSSPVKQGEQLAQ